MVCGKILCAWLVAAVIMLSCRSQELNGHINPLWLSSSRDLDYMSSLPLYYLDSTGAFRPLNAALTPSRGSNSPAIYRSSESGYNGINRSGYYNRLDSPYLTRNN